MWMKVLIIKIGNKAGVWKDRYGEGGHGNQDNEFNLGYIDIEVHRGYFSWTRWEAVE